MPKIAIIGGTALRRLPNMLVTSRDQPQTPYGLPATPLEFGRINDIEIVFLSRRGDNRVPPHKINYRANLWALHQIGVRKIISVAGMGGIRADMIPGCFAVPDQIIDYTHGREDTFFDDCLEEVKQVDFTYPYTKSLREILIKSALNNGIEIKEEATCGVTQGPRMETLAEIRKLDRDGCDLVSMTPMPEVVLARELDMDYANLALITNKAAGRRHGITLEDDRENVILDCIMQMQKILQESVSLLSIACQEQSESTI